MWAALIDTAGIQEYIFSSNSLRENLGASLLVQEIYHSFLAEAAQNIGARLDLDTWKQDHDRLQIQEEGTQVEVGYIGGGNALLFFKEREWAIKLIQEWTLSLLIKAPGLRTAIALSEFHIENFRQNLDALFEQLRENKSTYTSLTSIPRHGITAECKQSGYSTEVWLNNLPEPKYVSSMVSARYNADLNRLNGNMELDNPWTFTTELDKLGQQKDIDSHIAIVHIDGNSMSERFRKTQTLSSLRELSTNTHQAVTNSWQELVKHVQQELTKPEVRETLSLESENGRNYLPLRPIILGGDDITFVTEGRWGIYCAQKFLEQFERSAPNLSACAGIAITKTKYPFFRGYQLAEQLCSHAKAERRKNNHIGSWLDFHLAYSGITGSLHDIRDRFFCVTEGQLTQRPYTLANFEHLLENTKKLKQQWPSSKIKELREILTMDESTQETFTQAINARNKPLKLPVPDGFSPVIAQRLFEDRKTPYFDMIALMEIYPPFILEAQ